MNSPEQSIILASILNNTLNDDQINKIKQNYDSFFNFVAFKGEKAALEKIYELCPKMDIVAKGNQNLRSICEQGYYDCAEWLYDVCLNERNVKLSTEVICATYRNTQCCANHKEIYEWLKKKNDGYRFRETKSL